MEYVLSRREEERGEDFSERTVIYQKAGESLSRTGQPRSDHLPPRALLSPTWNSCSPGWPSPHVLSPPPGNQSRSSYFRAIQPLPPVLCGPNARDVSRAEFLNGIHRGGRGSFCETLSSSLDNNCQGIRPQRILPQARYGQIPSRFLRANYVIAATEPETRNERNGKPLDDRVKVDIAHF